MGILSCAAFFILLGGGGRILRAISLDDVTARRLLRLVGNAGRVGSHIGNQANMTLAGHFDAFVQLLRDLHRPLGIKSELARGFLLQSAGDKRRGRVAPLLASLD